MVSKVKELKEEYFNKYKDLDDVQIKKMIDEYENSNNLTYEDSILLDVLHHLYNDIIPVTSSEYLVSLLWYEDIPLTTYEKVLLLDTDLDKAEKNLKKLIKKYKDKIKMLENIVKRIVI